MNCQGMKRITGTALWVLGLACSLVGCALGPGSNGRGKFVFYPLAPAPPRVQHLTGFAGGRDPEAVSGKFAQFVVGGEDSQQGIAKPYGLAITNSQLFICDTAARAVGVLDLRQGTLRFMTSAGAGKFGVPINLAFDADGSSFVTDTGRNQVLCFDAAGAFVGMLQETNSIRPTGVAVTAERIYVSDLTGHCIRVYEKASRQLLFTIPPNPTASEDIEPGKLYMPVNLALDAQGRVYVSDLAVCRVKIFDAAGKFLRAIGSQGDLPGQFARPKGIAVDRAGRIFVVDAASQSCQIFDAEGQLLLNFGEPGAATAEARGTLNLPAAVCVDYEHIPLFQEFAAPGFAIEELIFISNQLGDEKVSVFALGDKVWQ